MIIHLLHEEARIREDDEQDITICTSRAYIVAAGQTKGN